MTIVEFWTLVDKSAGPDACWPWMGVIGDNGYGVAITLPILCGRRERPHRLALLLSDVSIPEGMVADHICRNRQCVNPKHLRVVTPEVNSLENSVSPIALMVGSAWCSHGHPFTPENTYPRRDGTRACRECRRNNASRMGDKYEAMGLTRSGKPRTSSKTMPKGYRVSRSQIRRNELAEKHRAIYDARTQEQP